jgi:hypothetical protein
MITGAATASRGRQTSSLCRERSAYATDGVS